LIVWQRAIQLSVAIYETTEKFPRSEIYGLGSQLRRAGVSVASNIAEGYGRGSRGEYKHFLGMARGSNHEVQTQIVIARELAFGEESGLARAERFSFEVGKTLFSIIKGLDVQQKATTGESGT
jgi:four helix bundle protein